MSVLIQTPALDQTQKWPTGCESVTAVMLLAALGCPVTVEEWVENAIECRPFYEKDGALCGPDPREYFAGRPEEPSGMGCYPPVLVKGLARCLGGGYRVLDATGAPMERLLKSLDSGIPVPFWATIGLKEAIEGPSWRLENGETFTWRSNEHCMLLVGYDEESYWFNDPLNAANGPVAYPKALVEQRHAEQYGMAVLVERI